MKFNKIKKCKGLVFIGYSSTFFNYKNKYIVKKESFKLLKRKSCKENCAYNCHFFFEDIGDMVECEGVIFPENIEHGKLYGIRITNEQIDWETGITDQYDYEFYLLKEQDNNAKI